MKKQFIVAQEELSEVVEYIRQCMKEHYIFTFEGVLGAGKTTLISRVLRACNIQGPITSPTFTYINRYTNVQGQTFYHFDLYRIQTVDQFLEAGFEEYLHQPESWVFIEWPGVIHPLLRHYSIVTIELSYYGVDKRLIEIRF